MKKAISSFILCTMISSTIQAMVKEEKKRYIWPDTKQLSDHYHGIMQEDPLCLHHACSDGNLPEVKIFMALGMNLENQDALGWTPLHWACHQGKKIIVKFLIKHGADIKAKDQGGETPLFKALKNISLIDFLLQRGAILEHMNDKGETLLQKALGLRLPKRTIEFLLQSGTDVNTVCTHGYTPLIKSIELGKAFIVDLLCRYGADLNMQTSRGRVPLHNAIHYSLNNPEIIPLLLFHGAKVLCTDKRGISPLSIGIKRLNSELSGRAIDNIILIVLFSDSKRLYKTSRKVQSLFKYSNEDIEKLVEEVRKNFISFTSKQLGANIPSALTLREITGRKCFNARMSFH